MRYSVTKIKYGVCGPLLLSNFPWRRLTVGSGFRIRDHEGATLLGMASESMVNQPSALTRVKHVNQPFLVYQHISWTYNSLLAFLLSLFLPMSNDSQGVACDPWLSLLPCCLHYGRTQVAGRARRLLGDVSNSTLSDLYWFIFISNYIVAFLCSWICCLFLFSSLYFC